MRWLRRHAIRITLAFLALYLVCDQLALIQTGRWQDAVSSTLQEVAKPFASLPHQEWQPDSSEVKWNVTFTDFLLHGSSAGSSPSSSLIDVRVYSTDRNTREFVEDHYEPQK
jgi:hypothetical protein